MAVAAYLPRPLNPGVHDGRTYLGQLAAEIRGRYDLDDRISM
jgi:hypothetical protein